MLKTLEYRIHDKNGNLTDIFSVGDIVDLKVNGAVQKGSVQFQNSFLRSRPTVQCDHPP